MKSCPCYIREAKSQLFWIAKLSTRGLDSSPTLLYGRICLGCNAKILFYFWPDMNLWFMGLNYSCNHGVIKSHSPRPNSIQVIGGHRTISMTMYPTPLQHFKFTLETWSTLCPPLYPNELCLLWYFQQSVKNTPIHALCWKF